MADETLPHTLATCVGKLFTGDIFGIEKYLPADAVVEHKRLRDMHGRERVGLVHLEQLCEAEHRVQWGAQFVAHAREKLALSSAGRLGGTLG